MSRVILSRYLNDGEHIVVGWDRPLQTFYWQIFNEDPPKDENGDTDWPEDWEEMIAYGGYTPREYPTAQDMVRGAPEEVRNLLDLEIMSELIAHQFHPNPGNLILDLSKEQ
jgi:hypothetical protein